MAQWAQQEQLLEKGLQTGELTVSSWEEEKAGIKKYLARKELNRNVSFEMLNFSPEKIYKISMMSLRTGGKNRCLMCMKKVTIYTDGGCQGNPGPGGYGAVLLYGEHRKELSGGYKLTTNNRMELLACIVALEALKEQCDVTIYSDSKYVVDSLEKGWAKRWRANGWKRNKKDKAENPDLWKRLLDLSAKHTVHFNWVKGHAGNKENERCDTLAAEAAKQDNLPEDKKYEEMLNPKKQDVTYSLF